jgi:drug/metabolite transporter (DMT)-like permease
MSTKQESSALPYRLRLNSTAATGPLLMLSSAFLFAVGDCLIKSLGPPFRVWDIAFYRFGCGMLILLLVFGRNRNLFDGQNRKLLVLRGLAGSLAFLAMVLAIRLIPISTAMMLFYAHPAFAALLSAYVFKEKMAGQLFWAFVALCGVAVFLDSKLEGGLLGQAISLLGAAFAGLAVVVVRKVRETNGPVSIYFYFCLTGTTLTFLPFISNPQVPASVSEWLTIGSIVTTSLIAQLLMTQGFHYCRSCEGSLLLTSEVLFVALWGFFSLGETLTWRFWVGGTMILGSIVALRHSIARIEN